MEAREVGEGSKADKDDMADRSNAEGEADADNTETE